VTRAALERIQRRAAPRRIIAAVVQSCGCATPEERALFPRPDDGEFSLSLVRVQGRGCRRPAFVSR
jgi:hypothetical protein